MSATLAALNQLQALKYRGDTPLRQFFIKFDEAVGRVEAVSSALSEPDRVCRLLNSLPRDYDGVVTAIQTIGDEEILLATVKVRLLDYEAKLKNSTPRASDSGTSSKVLHAAAAGADSSYSKGNSSGNAHFSRRNNLRGVGRRNKQFGSGSNKFSGLPKCHFCRKPGHKIQNCYSFENKIKSELTAEKSASTAVRMETDKPLTSTSGFAFMAGGDLAVAGAGRSIVFLVDSGASDHLVNDATLFQEWNELEPPTIISTAKKDSFITATKRGNIRVKSDMGFEGVIENVLYCPDVPQNLLSVRRMQQAGLTVSFDRDGISIRNKYDKIIIRGNVTANLFTIVFRVGAGGSCNNICKNDYKIWHQRLGHISKNKFLLLRNKQMVSDVNLIGSISVYDDLCEACIAGKQARKPFNYFKDKSYVKRPLFIVHSDVCGPITPTAMEGQKYFVTFIDEHTHYCVVYLLTRKCDVFAAFKDFLGKAEAHFNLKLVNLYCDNGGEYLSGEMKDYFVQRGISYHLTVPRTPELNGVAERMNRTIIEMSRALISGAQLNKIFWGEAVLTACYLINRIPTRALGEFKTPYELWHGRKPDLKYLKVFGATAFVRVHENLKESKIDENSTKGILVGYLPNGYKIFKPEVCKFIVARDVIFDETTFLITRPALNFDDLDITDSEAADPDFKITGQSTGTDDLPVSLPQLDTGHAATEESIPLDGRSIQDVVEPRRSDRIKNRRPVSYEETNDRYDFMLCANSAICKVPTSFEEIKGRDDRLEWEEAIRDELDSHVINNTWDLVPRPQGRNIIDCKWVFSIKLDEFGRIYKRKARLVARGFTQQYLIDYDETFAPVARIASFRFLIAFANQFNLLIHHMDVKTAFLNGSLKEELYMQIPPGVECGDRSKVCKLNKSLYGLKQAARCWFELFENALVERGFKNSEVDRCIYFLDRNDVNKNIYVVLYVDDVVIATADRVTMKDFKNYLMRKFSMKDLGNIRLFLGIKIDSRDGKLTLDQSAYIKTVLEKFRMADCNPVSTPLPTKLNYEALGSDEPCEAPCQSLIGCLMYLMICTRPDLSISVNILSRYASKNNRELWECLKRVLQYLKGTIDLKLTYNRGNFSQFLIGFVDADFAGDLRDRRSTTGFLFKLFETCTVCWNTRKQSSVAGASTDAEYMALYEGVREALWLKSLAAGIGIKIATPICIFEDNTGAISIANNPSSHKRSKHIDVKYHFSREQVANNTVKLFHVSTEKQIADILTKPLAKSTFVELRLLMGLQ